MHPVLVCLYLFHLDIMFIASRSWFKPSALFTSKCFCSLLDRLKYTSFYVTKHPMVIHYYIIQLNCNMFIRIDPAPDVSRYDYNESSQKIQTSDFSIS